jgi:hypothetical protein
VPTAMSVCARVKGRGIVVATRGGEEGWVGWGHPYQLVCCCGHHPQHSCGAYLTSPPVTRPWQATLARFFLEAFLCEKNMG